MVFEDVAFDDNICYRNDDIRCYHTLWWQNYYHQTPHPQTPPPRTPNAGSFKIILIYNSNTNSLWIV